MSVTRMRRWTRALTIAAVLAVGLTSLAIPAATPAEAGSLPDLEMHATADVTLNLQTSVLAHRFIVGVNGTAPVAPGKAVAVVSFPAGVQPIPTGIQVLGQASWSCTIKGNVLRCMNTTELRQSLGATYFIVSLSVSGPMTTTVTSTVDPANILQEMNEGNNVGTTTYHFVQ
jgi:hypothetical protein